MGIESAHDKFFKETFGALAIARDFLENYLPPDILEHVDLDSLAPQKDSFITADLQESFSDLVFIARVQEKESYLCFLLEHKSYSAPDLMFQLMKYTAEIWATKMLKERVKVLPNILPIVIYHGQRPWKLETSLNKMLPEFPPGLERIAPNFGFLLYNLPQLKAAELKGGPFLRITIGSLKVIFSPEVEKIEELLLNAAQDLGKLEEKERSLLFFETVVRYLLNSHADLPSNLLRRNYPQIERVYPEGGELLVTLAEQLKEQGRQEGILLGFERGVEEGIEQGIKRVIKSQILAGVSLELIIKTSGLTEQEVLKLARTLKEAKNGEALA